MSGLTLIRNEAKMWKLSRSVVVTVVCLSTLILAACDGGRGYSRGVFHGIVIDKTEAEITDKLGKPESVQMLGDDPADRTAVVIAVLSLALVIASAVIAYLIVGA